MGLVQAEIERRGIVTASLTMLPEVTRKMRVPRALSVPYPLGFPLGAANDAGLQLAILRSLLAVAQSDDVPHLAQFEPPPAL